MPASFRHRFDHRWSSCLILITLTALVYWPVAWFSFLNWDDPWYVLDNPLVKSWAPTNLWAIATQPCSKNFAPLTIFMLLVEHTAFGSWAGGYHIVNALLHAVNACLVLVLVRQISGSRWIAWFTAVLFTVHPIQVETVAWVSSLKSLLAAAFMLSSLLCWLKPQRTTRDEGYGLLWLVLALLCKASAVVTPAVVLAWDVMVQRRKPTEAFSRQVLPGLFCLMALFLNMHAQNQIWGGSREHFDWGLARILAVDAVLLWRYARMLLVPDDLSVMYDIRGEGIGRLVAAAVMGWIAVATVIWRIRRTQPVVAWAAVTFLLLMFPVLNVFPITTLMNDRYLYLPCVLVFATVAYSIQAFAAWFAGSAASRSALEGGGLAAAAAVRRRWIVGTAVAVGMAVSVGVYSAMAQTYLNVWRNPTTLWQHAVASSPGLPVVQIQWALTLRDRGETIAAREILKDVLRGPRADEGDRRRIERLLSEWNDAGQVATRTLAPAGA